jgi:hypothetical protein
MELYGDLCMMVDIVRSTVFQGPKGKYTWRTLYKDTSIQRENTIYPFFVNMQENYTSLY